MRRSVGVVVCLIACKSHAPTSNVEGTTSASAASPPIAAASAKPDARVVLETPITDEGWKRYWAAMKRGRAATVRKDYPAAIHAFDEAVTIVPRDARARSERGYAKFLSGDNAGATTDFDDAIDRVPANEKVLAAQIYFNEGLAAEKAGADVVAASYFRQSYELNPTTAAKSKMGSCPVVIESFTVDHAADRAAALASIKAKKSATDVDDLGDNVVGARDGNVDALALLPVASGLAIVDTGVDVTMGMKGPAGDVSVEHTGREWIVTGQARVPGEMNCVADGPCDMLPPVPGGTHDVFYVDATSGAALWHASYDFAFAARVALAVENGSLHVTGAGCDITRPRPP